MNEEHHLNESYIDIDELKKALNVSEFARSLLPELDKFIDTGKYFVNLLACFVSREIFR